jgi:hypothetical protein
MTLIGHQQTVTNFQSATAQLVKTVTELIQGTVLIQFHWTSDPITLPEFCDNHSKVLTTVN